MLDVVAGILFYVEEALSKQDLKTVTVHHKLDIHLSAASGLLIKRIVKMVASWQEFMGQIVNYIIDKPGFVVPAPAQPNQN